MANESFISFMQAMQETTSAADKVKSIDLLYFSERKLRNESILLIGPDTVHTPICLVAGILEDTADNATVVSAIAKVYEAKGVNRHEFATFAIDAAYQGQKFKLVEAMEAHGFVSRMKELDRKEADIDREVSEFIGKEIEKTSALLTTLREVKVPSAAPKAKEKKPGFFGKMFGKRKTNHGASASAAPQKLG